VFPKANYVSSRVVEGKTTYTLVKVSGEEVTIVLGRTT